MSVNLLTKVGVEAIKNKIGRDLLSSCLLKVHSKKDGSLYSKILSQEGPDRSFHEEVLDAAKMMKDSGLGWEEWT